MTVGAAVKCSVEAPKKPLSRGTAGCETPVGIESEALSAALRASKHVLEIIALPEYNFVVFLVDVSVLQDPTCSVESRAQRISC